MPRKRAIPNGAAERAYADLARTLYPHIKRAPDCDQWLRAYAEAIDELRPTVSDPDQLLAQAIDCANRKAGPNAEPAVKPPTMRFRSR